MCRLASLVLGSRRLIATVPTRATFFVSNAHEQVHSFIDATLCRATAEYDGRSHLALLVAAPKTSL